MLTKKIDKFFNKKLFVQIVIPSLVATFFVVAVVWGATTVGSNISTGGTLTVTGASTLSGDLKVGGYATTTAATGAFATLGPINASSTSFFTGAATFYGSNVFGDAAADINLFTGTLQASTTALFTSGLTSYGTITLQNAETIDNATDGVISLMGVASSTSIRLTNLETITNGTDGTITLANDGGATISFTPATGVVTPSFGTLFINATSTTMGNATTTVDGVIMPTIRTAAPVTCSASYAGALLYNSAKKVFCFCNSSAWTVATSTTAESCF